MQSSRYFPYSSSCCPSVSDSCFTIMAGYEIGCKYRVIDEDEDEKEDDIEGRGIYAR